MAKEIKAVKGELETLVQSIAAQIKPQANLEAQIFDLTDSYATAIKAVFAAHVRAAYLRAAR